MNAEQRIQFEHSGFLHLPGHIPPDLVRRLAMAFDAAAARSRGAWERQVERGEADSRYFDIPDILDQNDAFVDLVDLPKAGDCVLFNTHVLHMALDNSSDKVRKSLIYAYSHFWVKNYANGVPKDLTRLADTPLRRQLFGIEEPGLCFFDQRYSGETKKDEGYGSFKAASKRLLRRLSKASPISMR